MAVAVHTALKDLSGNPAADRRGRLFALGVAAYFAIQLLIRLSITDSLDRDESEQMFLTQWLRLGYNTQPPLYTWIQTSIFAVAGPSILGLSLFKNALLWGTYWFVFATTRRVSGSTIAGVAASLGLLTIPQIAWESQRDLAHSVAVTFAAAWLVDAVTRLEAKPTLRGYLEIAAAVAAGILSKYSFCLVVTALIGGALWSSRYRRLVLDGRMAFCVIVAASLVAPHAFWAIRHPDMATAATVAKLSDAEAASWGWAAVLGIVSLSKAAAAASGLTIAVAAMAFANVRKKNVRYPSKGTRPPETLRQRCRKLLARAILLRPPERLAAPQPHGLARRLSAFAVLLGGYLVCSVALLSVLALTGNMTSFKDRWLQPILVFLPMWICLRMEIRRQRDPHRSQAIVRGYRRVAMVGVVAMVAVTIAIILRPMSSRVTGHYRNWNTPYSTFAAELGRRAGSGEVWVVAPNMRTAGNLRLHWPGATVMSAEYPLLVPTGDGRDQPIVLVDFRNDGDRWRHLSNFAKERLGAGGREPGLVESIAARYWYARDGDDARLYYRSMR